MENNQEKLLFELRKLEVKYKMNKGVDSTMRTNNEMMEMRRVLEKEENRMFYNSVLLTSKGEGGVGLIGLDIPADVETRIREKLKIFSSLYNEVQTAQVGVDGRAVVTTGSPIAKWGRETATIEEINAEFQAAEMEDVKLSGYFTLDRMVAEDADVLTALNIEDILVGAFARGIDDGVINGAGDYITTYEPIGVLMNLPETNKITAPFDKTITDNINLITTGNPDMGEVIAVMKRKTYYANMNDLANTALPYPNVNGLRVKFVSTVADDVIILGDFKEYVLGERRGLKISHSDHLKFIDDIRVYKITGRYDGKPISEGAFVEITKQVV